MEKKLSSNLLYEGRNFKFKTDEVRLLNGSRTKRDIVEHPGAAAIIPVLPNGKIVLIKQYRYAVKKDLLEIPAGTIERKENPLKCAKRELKEETGYEAKVMKGIMKCYIAPGYSSELIHFYIASGLKKVYKQEFFDEVISLEILKLEEILRMIKANDIMDAKTIVGIYSYLNQESN